MENRGKVSNGSGILCGPWSLIIQGELIFAWWALKGDVHAPQAGHGARGKRSRTRAPSGVPPAHRVVGTPGPSRPGRTFLSIPTSSPAPRSLPVSLDELESRAVRILGANRSRHKGCP